MMVCMSSAALNLAQLRQYAVARSLFSPTTLPGAIRRLGFVQAQGTVRPAQVDAHFDHGRARNWFGGQSRISTQLLDEMQ